MRTNTDESLTLRMFPHLTIELFLSVFNRLLAEVTIKESHHYVEWSFDSGTSAL